MIVGHKSTPRVHSEAFPQKLPKRLFPGQAIDAKQLKSFAEVFYRMHSSIIFKDCHLWVLSSREIASDVQSKPKLEFTINYIRPHGGKWAKVSDLIAVLFAEVHVQEFDVDSLRNIRRALWIISQRDGSTGKRFVTAISSKANGYGFTNLAKRALEVREKFTQRYDMLTQPPAPEPARSDLRARIEFEEKSAEEALSDVIGKEQLQYKAIQQKAAILAEAPLREFYEAFQPLFNGVINACFNFYSGMHGSAGTTKATARVDTCLTIASWLEKLDVLFPGIKIVLNTATGPVQVYNYLKKKEAVYLAADFFPSLTACEFYAELIARQLTLTQRKLLMSMPLSVGSVKEKGHQVYSKSIGNGMDTSPRKRLAQEQCDRLLIAIMQGDIPKRPLIKDVINLVRIALNHETIEIVPVYAVAPAYIDGFGVVEEADAEHPLAVTVAVEASPLAQALVHSPARVAKMDFLLADRQQIALQGKRIVELSRRLQALEEASETA